MQNLDKSIKYRRKEVSSSTSSDVLTSIIKIEKLIRRNTFSHNSPNEKKIVMYWLVLLSSYKTRCSKKNIPS